MQVCPLLKVLIITTTATNACHRYCYLPFSSFRLTSCVASSSSSRRTVANSWRTMSLKRLSMSDSTRDLYKPPAHQHLAKYQLWKWKCCQTITASSEGRGCHSWLIIRHSTFIPSFFQHSFSPLTVLVGWQEGHPVCKTVAPAPIPKGSPLCTVVTCAP